MTPSEFGVAGLAGAKLACMVNPRLAEGGVLPEFSTELKAYMGMDPLAKATACSIY